MDKEFVIKDSQPPQTVTVQIPETCDEWSSNIRPNLNDFIIFSSQEKSLKTFYEKLKLVSLFGNNLKDITTAQCVINHNTIVLNTGISDHDFFNQIVKSYVEFQSISDLLLNNLTDEQKLNMKDAVIEIYKTIYSHKREELLDLMSDLTIIIDVGQPGVNVILSRNDSMIQGSVSNVDGLVEFTVDKKLTLPEPDETIVFKFKIGYVGYADKMAEFSLGEMKAKSSNIVSIEYDIDKAIDFEGKNKVYIPFIKENYEFKKKEINEIIKKHKGYEK